MRAVILAGGQGVRVRPLTFAVPGRADRLDGRSLAVNRIDRVEDFRCVEPERRA